MSNRLLIAGITPYFLEKGFLWFEENKRKLLLARQTQSFFADNLQDVAQGTALRRSELLRRLDELGYEKVLSVAEPGEFAVRGGDVEVFPVNTQQGWRVGFVGNRVQELEPLKVTVESEEHAGKVLSKKLRSQKAFSDLTGLREGDFLVHLDHGIGRFAGVRTHTFGEHGGLYYALEYAARDKLFVPKGLERKLSRYVGFTTPKVSRLGSPLWSKTKRRIREEVEKLAGQLLELYAQKESAERLPYLETPELVRALELSFPFEETPDQERTLQDIAEDLAQPRPMDRIVAGDVGFGKTEVALRAMVRAAGSGRQAAMLSPTTILAHQHYEHFLSRLKDLPVRTALLSRVQTRAEQEGVLRDLKEGTLDIVVGTHRLLSKDVRFKNLGLLVIDEEQKFGVRQKERLRELRSSLDVLSLSATPIPRTLYMALSSLKGVSTMQTAPEGRTSVKTHIGLWNRDTVKKAVAEELKRGGRVYVLHNRVGTIEKAKEDLQELAPRARVAVAHGRLKETRLIDIVEGFRRGRYDVLLATTIIENGVDIPQANTIIVEDASKLGLAQAYQLKGRVGRSRQEGKAYFFHPKNLTRAAKLRLKALKEAEELGSGYRLALRDLEIRGAGNILGKEQSGAVNTVGLNLYCQMLSVAVERRRALTRPRR